ncbi:phage major capsid protein [Pseudarthrobacter sp. HLT3-5]|uniref:phage major capsid protein n=1 Tax=Pseudarthrobacter cellobiosi TaxID=2953654 RepID=UPI00208F6EC5|nr:phage major capsid protein [Pseudarthrobacter sp. HLT3-5]MCO4276719.1 phage major capsid protein [Pseudarthrobacter sp. HLT3-5]
MKFKSATERTLALDAAQELVGSALKAGRNLTADEAAEVEATIKAADDFTQGTKGRALLDAIGKSGSAPELVRTPDGGYFTDTSGLGSGEVEYLDLGSKGHSNSLLNAMKENRGYGSKALVTNGSVVIGTPLINQTPITLGRPLRTFLQNIPTVPRPASYSFLAQVSRTDNAAVVPAGGLKPTTAMGLEKKPGKLSVIATLSEPIDKFVLEDDAALGGWVGMELTQSVAVALETQVLSGDGVGDNLTGLANTSGIQLFTSAAGNTDKLVEMRKALTKLETVGETPSVFILNPNDWEAIATKRNTSGEFDTGNAIDAEKRTAWGVPVAISTALVPNSYYVLGENAVAIGRDGGIRTEWGTPGDMFQRNQVQARTEGRFGLEVTRPKAIVKGTFVTV